MKRPWVRVDAGIADDPKMIDAGPLAVALHIAAIGKCAQIGSDGVIRKSAAHRLLDVEEYGTTGLAVATRLVSAGAWVEDGESYRIVAFLDWQESATKRGARQAADRERKRRPKPTETPSAPLGFRTESERNLHVETEEKVPPSTPPVAASVPAAPVDVHEVDSLLAPLRFAPPSAIPSAIRRRCVGIAQRHGSATVSEVVRIVLDARPENPKAYLRAIVNDPEAVEDAAARAAEKRRKDEELDALVARSNAWATQYGRTVSGTAT